MTDIPGARDYRLAELEFRALVAELVHGAAPGFETVTPMSQTDDTALVASTPNSAPPDLDVFGLPALRVPLGHIACAPNSDDLKVIGILIPRAPVDALRPGLAALFGEHHRSPFGKLLFICEDLDLIALLGRYGFAYHHLQYRVPEHDFAMLAARFAMTEVRNLTNGTPIWHAPENSASGGVAVL